MSRLQRLRRRRADRSSAAHERARGLVAEQLDGALAATDATWLADHLDGCEACRSVAAAYEADRAALRGLRDQQPEPPRDLWARTAAAIERESAGRHSVSRRAIRSARSGAGLGVLSGVAVIAVVLGASVLSGGFGGGAVTGIVPGASTPGVAITATATPGATPFDVNAGAVGWVGTSPGGSLAYNVTPVDKVCPADKQPDCATVADKDSKRVEIAIQPKSISQSPVRNQAVVVGTDTSGGDSVVVIVLPTPEPSASPTANPTPTSIVSSTDQPPATPVETASATDTPTPTVAPTATPEPTPTAPIEPTPTPTVTASASPSMTPEPTIAAALAIVSKVKIVGQSAAYSPDGAWFAFTARPSNDSAGPDIYLWRVGDPLAHPVTTDHVSVFASWAGGRLLGSRPAPSADSAGEVAARSFFIDPATGTETAIDAPVWRPIVDPPGDRAVAWVGTVKLAADGLTTVPASGALVLSPFTSSFGPEPTPDGSAATPATTPVIAEGPVSEFDVRWDESGTWLAVWVADGSDGTIGRLSLIHVDPTTGALDRPDGAPQDVTALPGFSIEEGRLAWATPPGQGGDGSRVQIVAWKNDTVGAVESAPTEGVVVVH
jgi:Putative zinc-finger